MANNNFISYVIIGTLVGNLTFTVVKLRNANKDVKELEQKVVSLTTENNKLRHDISSTNQFYQVQNTNQAYPAESPLAERTATAVNYANELNHKQTKGLR